MPPRLDDVARSADDLIRRLDGPPIRAYHGSPYDFDRFDASKIDTGEGAQAYGHGLYFAGNEGVARSYRDDLSRGSFMVEGAGTPWTESTMDFLGVRPRARATLRMAVRDGADPLDRLRQAQSGTGPLSAPWNEYQDAIELLRGAGGKLIPNKGRMYEVQIAHPESALLDWDAPMSAQPKSVQRAFGDMAMDRPGDGRRVYQDIVTRRGEEFDDDATGLLAGRAAADELMAEGIPGIRYLDQGSRHAGEGTRNYVMFPGTEDSITILRKYGLLPPLAGAAALRGDDQP